MSSNLEYARLSYASDLLVGVTFGIYVILATICIYFLLQRPNTSLSHRIILGYTITMLITGTIWFVCGAWNSELEIVEFPSTIGQFTLDDALYNRLDLIKKVFYIVNIFLADSLLSYRVFIIWGRSLLIAAIPAIVWLGVVASGIATMVITSQPQASIQASSVIHIQTAFFCLSVSLNVFCTLLISWKLLHQQRLAKQLGSTGSKTYTPIVIIIAESAALYSIFGIVNIPLGVLQSPVQFPFNSLVGTLTLIAPNLIILRVALGSTEPQPPMTKATTTLRFERFGDSGSNAAPGSYTATQGGTSQLDALPLPASDSESKGDDSHASSAVIDIGDSEGPSSERLVQNGEKDTFMV